MHTPVPAPYHWRLLLNLALKHRWVLIWANLIALGAALASVPVPLLLPLLVDEVLLHQPGAAVASINALFPITWQGATLYLSVMLLLTVLLRALTVALNVWQTWHFTRIAKEITYQLRKDLLGRLERAALVEYELLGSGAVSSHFVTDMEALDQFIGNAVGRFVVASLSLVGIAVVLLWIHWELALLILILNPLVILLTTWVGGRVKELKRRENSAYERFQQRLTETLDAIVQLRASNRAGHYLHRVATEARAVRDHAVAYTWQSDAANRTSFLIFLAGFDAFRALSMGLVVFSDLSIGEMLAVFGYLWFMMTPVQEILNIQYSYYSARAALHRLNRLARLHPEPDYPAQADPFAGVPTVSVTVEGLRFRYAEGPWVLDDLGLHIRAGEKVALVGASGGGKSTLVQVLLGLYPLDSGQIRYGGALLEQIGLARIREQVAVVLQHPALFNDTVRQNLTLGRELPEAALWQALELAQLRPDIEALPQGLDSVLGRQGIRLSGGQRQRLAIARMILTQPKVVILDEATSALDTATEARLHQALQGFLAGRTTLIIAHRLSAVKQADRVYVFDAGKIIEQGAHQELLDAGGLYTRLYGTVQTP